MRERTLTTQIVVRVDPETKRLIEADADANGRSVSQSVRYLVRKALAEETNDA